MKVAGNILLTIVITILRGDRTTRKFITIIVPNTIEIENRPQVAGIMIGMGMTGDFIMVTVNRVKMTLFQEGQIIGGYTVLRGGLIDIQIIYLRDIDTHRLNASIITVILHHVTELIGMGDLVPVAPNPGVDHQAIIQMVTPVTWIDVGEVTMDEVQVLPCFLTEKRKFTAALPEA